MQSHLLHLLGPKHALKKDHDLIYSQAKHTELMSIHQLAPANQMGRTVSSEQQQLEKCCKLVILELGFAQDNKMASLPLHNHR